MGENGCRFSMTTGNLEASNGLVRSQFQIPQQDFSLSTSICSSIQYLSQHFLKTWSDRRNFILKIRELLQVLAQLFLVSVLFHVLHSILAKITWGGEERKPEMFQSVTFKVTGLLWMTSLSNLAYTEGFHLNSGQK